MSLGIQHLICFALGIMYLVSAVTKTRQRSAAVTAISQFGLGRAFAIPVTVVIIISEYVLGLAFVSLVQIRLAAASSAILLSFFTIAVVFRLANGHVFNCGCFGDFSRGRTTWGTVFRNLLAIAGSLIIVIQPEFIQSGLGTAQVTSVLETLQWVLIIGLTIVLAGALRSIGELRSILGLTSQVPKVGDKIVIDAPSNQLSNNPSPSDSPNEFILFSRSDCPHCENVKRRLLDTPADRIPSNLVEIWSGQSEISMSRWEIINDSEGKISQSAGVKMFPTLIEISRDKIVLSVDVGDESIAERLDDLLQARRSQEQ